MPAGAGRKKPASKPKPAAKAKPTTKRLVTGGMSKKTRSRMAAGAADEDPVDTPVRPLPLLSLLPPPFLLTIVCARRMSSRGAAAG